MALELINEMGDTIGQNFEMEFDYLVTSEVNAL